MATSFRLLDEEHTLAPARRTETVTLTIDDHIVNVDTRQAQRGGSRYVVDGVTRDAVVACEGDMIYIHLDGEVWAVEAIDPIAAAGGGGSGTNVVRAPMPGVIVSVRVAAGDSVSTGQTLLLIESMKLQTSIVAERDGVIAAINFAEDATFEKGAELLRYAETATP